MSIRLKVAIFISSIFFIFGVLTLPSYGINWDTINHLPRGQAYLHYFLTGKKDYSDMILYKKYWQNPDSLFIDTDIQKSELSSRSYYQSDAVTFNYFMEKDGDGHPPLSDILSSVFNRLLFGKLRLINDIDSYRVYGVLLAASLVGLLYYWTSKVYGNVAGIIASLSLALYPLYWSESHFNTEKDIPEASFWSFFLYFFYKGFTKKDVKSILVSGVFFGLALGTKFNILFVLPITIIWIIIYFGKKIIEKNNIKLIGVGMVAISIGIAIFYITWPYLWQDVITGSIRVFGFYKSIGTASTASFNFYPIRWIIYTTPIPILILTLFGSLVLIKDLFKDKTKIGLLILLWFFIPIIRVTMPNTNIYGGVRQIMEYIPAMAIISGVGAMYIYNNLKINKILILGIFALSFGSVLFNLYKIHPNENVYFNVLIGGLDKAKEKNIPSWGNTFGAAYRQGFSWINKNAPFGSNLVFVNELMPNAPYIWVRSDINFQNTQRSGFLRKGEYAITITYQGTNTRSYYDSYLENFVKPVYESQVDGVGVVKVWKNSQENVYDPYKAQKRIDNVIFKSNKKELILDLKNTYSLAYMYLVIEKSGCAETTGGSVSTSTDLQNWSEIPESLPTGSVSSLSGQPNIGEFYFPFLSQKARYIKVNYSPENSCLGQVNNINVFHFPSIDNN